MCAPVPLRLNDDVGIVNVTGSGFRLQLRHSTKTGVTGFAEMIVLARHRYGHAVRDSFNTHVLTGQTADRFVRCHQESLQKHQKLPAELFHRLGG
jgi:hypothetical protein